VTVCRLATALRAQCNLAQAITAAEAAEQYAATAADAAAAARLAAAIKQQQQYQQRPGDAQPGVSATGAAGKPVNGQTSPITAQLGQQFPASSSSSNAQNPAGLNIAAGSVGTGQAAADPLRQLLQQFAAAVGSSIMGAEPTLKAAAPGSQRTQSLNSRVAAAPGSHKAFAAALAREIKTPAAAAAASDYSTSKSGEQGVLTSLVMPQKQQGKKGAAAGRFVQVLANSDESEEPAAAVAASAAEEGLAQAGGAASASARPGQRCEAGFIMQEVASTRISTKEGGRC
jgi:hypothetical protein